MKKIRLFTAVVGALAGVTGAYATTRHIGIKYAGEVYNWYYNGQLAFSATIEVARSACLTGVATVCLRGTATILLLPPVTLLRR